jgi:hypothetical protein
MAAAGAGGAGAGAGGPAVLVLCQRSRSSRDGDVVETVNGILNFIEDGLGVGPEFRIRFCTPCVTNIGEKRKESCDNDVRDKAGGGDYADYNLSLNRDTLGRIKELMSNEKPPIESFDYVILHTCPFYTMDFRAISEIMGPDGQMIMTRVGDSGIVGVPKNSIIRRLDASLVEELSSRIYRFFDDVVGKPGFYIKKGVVQEMGLGGNKGSKKKGRKNTLRYKPKKSRSRYHRTRRTGSKKLN